MIILRDTHVKIKIIFFLLLYSLGQTLSKTAYAETVPTNSDNYEYDYPELSVVPRASDRIKNESEMEAGKKLTTFLPVQISSLATLVTGILSMDTVNYESSALGI